MKNVEKILFLIFLATAICLSNAAWAQPITDSFYATFDTTGEFSGGGGSGYNDGTWYYYPNTNWWNQWFYDHPFDPTRWKKIEYNIVVSPTAGAASYVDIVINWSSPLFPPSGPDGRPPLPDDFINDPALEAEWIVRELVFGNETPDSTDVVGSIIIPDYNPEWVSIDIRGVGVDIQGTIVHECIPEPATMVLLGLGVLTLLRRRKT